MKIDDNFFMKLAIDEAWKYQLLTYPNPAVGCVILKGNSEILSIEAHKEAGMPHAEINAIKEAYLKHENNSLLKTMKESHKIHKFIEKNHNGFFNDCTFYVTLEPCNHEGKTPSCAKLIAKIKPNKVVISIKDPNDLASGGIKTLEDAGIEVVTNVLKKEGLYLIEPFKQWNSNTFIFFKMAQTLNGSIDGKISNMMSQLYIHSLRDKIDLLMIGGNTVRTDKPKLDSRYVKGNNPDVLIYSKKKIFDQNIPLFKIPDRKVLISDDLFKLLDYKFVMVEGTYTLLNELRNKINYVLLVISPKVRKGLNSSLEELDLDFEIVHENYIGEEKIVFLKFK